MMLRTLLCLPYRHKLIISDAQCSYDLLRICSVWSSPVFEENVRAMILNIFLTSHPSLTSTY